MTSLQAKSCLECTEPFKGRADKKFCSDSCRTAFNNRLNTDGNKYIKNVNRILRKNRRILSELNPSGKNKVSFERLVEKGFDFNYFTSFYKTKTGGQYFYCYDHGYLQIRNDYCLLVVKKDTYSTA